MKDLNFSKGFVKSGTKNVSEASAKLTLTSTYSNFKLNNKAMAAIGVSDGERVVMFDMYSAGATNQDDRYYICAGFTDNEGVAQGALISKQRAFRYSGIYNTMLANNFELMSLSADDVVEQGLAIKRESVSEKTGVTTQMYIALKTASLDLIPVNDGEPVEVADGVERKLFKLTNIKFSAHTPKGGSEESYDATDPQDIVD